MTATTGRCRKPARGPAGGSGHEPDPVTHMTWHDPYAYLRDVMGRLPMQRASPIGEVLTHRWQPA